ncbi:MAG: hypothetical protein GY798_11710 [Hyphomicrobiales bacterium]|nr:hypothetical protein [Hyphomicrobiales bacterium]
MVGAASAALDDPAQLDTFVTFSVEATGFAIADLKDTGQSAVFFGTVRDAVGDALFRELLETYRDGGLATVLGNDRLGPVARNIIKLWYAATWVRLPTAWRVAYGVRPGDRTFVVSTDAYPTGLLWSAIGVNPPGADAPGFATWADPPADPSR